MSIAEKYNNLTPPQRRTVMAVAAVAVVLGVSWVLASVSETKASRAPYAAKPEVEVVSPQRATGVEGFNAELQALRKSQEEMKTKYERLLREQERPKLETAETDVVDLEPEPDLDEPFPELTPKTDVFSAPVSKGAELPPPVPFTAQPDLQQLATPAPEAAQPAPVPAAPPRPSIRVITQEGELSSEQVQEKLNTPVSVAVAKAPESAFIPAGSMFAGVILTGLDAPTSGVAQKNPTPVTIRVKREAVLPNYASIDVRECFVIASGYGQLSTERALLRAETLSCVRGDGQVIENAIDAYIVGTDGKVGVPGRLVSKQGQMIAQTLIAGTLGGIGQALSRSRVPALNVDPTKGESLYESDSVSSIMQSGVSGGLGSATNMIAKFYLDMAKETFPVVEIPAGEVATVVITRGSTLPLKGSTDLKKLDSGRTSTSTRTSANPAATANLAAVSNATQASAAQAPAEAAINAMNVVSNASQQAPSFQNGAGW